MENRYLYRGKRIDNGEWMQGYHAIIGGKPVIIEKEPEKYYDVDGGENRSGNKIVEIIPDTICQCTGLEDKNGKLIWENDIMEAHIDDDFPEDASRFKVEWNGRGWVENQPGAVDREHLDDFDTEYYAIVGNIFDNPGLLEV